ncbi:MAG: N5-glutamine methyltransferase family protein, partial [Croceimicrobium sp.]
MTIRTTKKQFLQEILEEAKGEFEKRFFLLLAMKYSYSRRDFLMEEDLETNSLTAFNEDLKALIKGKPVQHIIGFCDFGGLKIKVDERALIPRPETEELLGICRALRPKASNAIDLATGSACLALGLKQNIEKVYALEKSPEALSLARENAELNDSSIEFIEDDLLRPQKNWPKNLDLIVSNPPYVRNLEKDAMEGEVLSHEPHMALFVADDQPLVFYQ